MDLNHISQKIYEGFQKKYPEVDHHHFKPETVKSIILRSRVNYRSQEGLKSVITVLNQKLSAFKEQINKERQRKGVLDFTVDPQSKVSKQSLPQQALVIAQKSNQNPPQNHSRREFLNPNPVIINQDGPKVPLNQLVTRNQQTPNHQSFPAHPEDINLSGLDEPRTETNQSDHYILTSNQRNLFKEEDGRSVHYLIIDSKDRDFNMSASPNAYTIKFSAPSFDNSNTRQGYIDRSFHNVESIELVKCVFLDTSDKADASDNGNPPAYVSVEIDEFVTQHHGTNQYLNQSIAVLDKYSTQGNFKYYNLLYNDVGTITRFNPRITLDKITIRFRLPNGELYNFGADHDSTTSTVNFLVFKITHLQKNLQTNFFNQTLS